MSEERRSAVVVAKDILLNGGYSDRVDPKIITRMDDGSLCIKAGTELDASMFKDRAKDAIAKLPDAEFPLGKDLFEAWSNSKRCEAVEFVTQEVVEKRTEKKKSHKPSFLKG